jgi:hypothetical protein
MHGRSQRHALPHPPPPKHGQNSKNIGNKANKIDSRLFSDAIRINIIDR